MRQRDLDAVVVRVSCFLLLVLRNPLSLKFSRVSAGTGPSGGIHPRRMDIKGT